jgi:steroid delta-isomerase-like uncharacterized protein
MIIAEEYAHRIWDDKDLNAIQELLHPEVIIHSLLGDFVGQDAMRKIVEAWLTGFPDLSVVNKATICQDDRVVIQWKANGTHQGIFKNVPATGQSISYEGVSIYKICDRKIVEYWAYVDMQHLMNQLRM